MEDSRERYGGMAHEESYESIREFIRDPKYIHYVGMIAPPRPGVRLCAIKLEHTYFIPGTPSNEEFLLRIFEWCGMIWIMISIPREKSNLMEKVAAECGLRIADGVPTLIGSGAYNPFPFNDSSVFTLENIPGHPIYSNNPEVAERILMEEEMEMVAIEEKWRSRN